MERTGVFASKEEIEEIKKLRDIAVNIPVIALSVEHGLSTGGFAGEAWTMVSKTCHKYALNHGLPETSGFYGIDLSNGEFLKN